MPFKQVVSAKTAHGDTTKTLIDTITVPQGVSRLIGFAGHAVGGAGVTTVENVTGYFELESDDFQITPAQFLMDCITVLTSGSAPFKPTQWPCDIPVVPGGKIKIYATMDLAQTVANTCRAMLTFN